MNARGKKTPRAAATYRGARRAIWKAQRAKTEQYNAACRASGHPESVIDPAWAHPASGSSRHTLDSRHHPTGVMPRATYRPAHRGDREAHKRRAGASPWKAWGSNYAGRVSP